MSDFTIDQIITLRNEIAKITKQMNPELVEFNLNNFYPVQVHIEPIRDSDGFYLHFSEEIEGKNKIGLSLLADDINEDTFIASIHNKTKRYLKEKVLPIIEAKYNLSTA